MCAKLASPARVSSPGEYTPMSDQIIAIIGAGLSGLACARVIVDASVSGVCR